MVQKVKIKTESQPERCEICHQLDYFDPQTNNCSRCSSLVIVEKQDTSIKKKQIPYYSYYIEDDFAKKKALEHGVLRLITAVFLFSTLHGSGAFELAVILASIMSLIGGIISLIDWHHLKMGKDLILQNYRNIASQITLFLIVGICIAAQISIGKVDMLLSLIAGSSLLFSLLEYNQVRQKTISSNSETDSLTE